MARIAILGNAAAGKSTLARALARHRGLELTEIDKLLWRPGWQVSPPDVFARRHAEIIARDRWIIEGLGYRESIPERMARATEIVLIDLPLWMHFWLAAERQMAWMHGPIPDAPGGADAMPPTRELFRTIWEVDRTWMPDIRSLCDSAERSGKPVARLRSVEDLGAFPLPP